MRISRLADQMSGSEIIKIGNAVSEQIRQGATSCNLTIGDFDPQLFPIPEGLREGIIAAYQAGHTNYPPAPGIADLRQAAAEFLKTRLGLDYTYDDPADPNRFYYRSDHYNFAVKQVPVAFFFNGVHADYHEASDEISKIEFDKLEARARLVFYLAWDLANRDQRPVVDSNKP